MELTSSVFLNDSTIPVEYTCNGTNVSPPLTISGIPGGTESLALIVEDPDAPGGTFTHWVAYDIPPATNQISEGEAPSDAKQGLTDFESVGYGGPCPPEGEHRYIFKLFALDTTLGLEEGVNAQKVYDAMDGHILATAELTGRYEQKVIVSTSDDKTLEKKPDDPAAY